MVTQFPLSDALQWVYYSVGAFGVVGNGFVVVVMSSSRPLRRRSANIIIINQSAIDGLASLFFIAVAVPYGGVRSEIMCKLWLNRWPLWCLLVASTFNILFLALERHLAIIYALWHRSFFTKNKIIKLVLVPWVFGFSFNSTFAIPSTVFINETCLTYKKWPSDSVQITFGVFLIFIEYIMPIALQIFLYGRIVCALRHRVRRGPSVSCSVSTSGDLQPATRANQHWSRAQTNSVKTAMIVSITFGVCWASDQIYFLVYLLSGSKYYDVKYFSYALILIMINCCINPFIYALQYESFQRGVQNLFYGCCGRNSICCLSAKGKVVPMYIVNT